MTVAFAARDEAQHVEKAARSLLALDYPKLQIMTVDDRSVDGTGNILDRIQTEDSRLRVVHVKTLPNGWLGKTHAMQMALDASEAEWILFTDGDVFLAPDCIKKAISLAVRSSFDHLAAAPDVPSETVGERLFLSVFMTAFVAVASPVLVENPRLPVGIGIGAFSLVRTTLLKSLGGFERIRLSVDDDMKLGQMLKRNGGRTRLLSGHGTVVVRWQVGLWGMITGLEKNFFATQDFRVALPFFGIIGIVAMLAGPHIGLLADNWLRWVSVVGVAAICGVIGRIGPASRVRWYYGLTMPIGCIAVIVAMLRSAWLTLRRGGVVWRNHLYPLTELRAHVGERNRWFAASWKATRRRQKGLPLPD